MVDLTQRPFAGDRSALGRFEAFLVAAVATVVLVRSFLIVTGYPQVGGGGLHIAHVLWGGLLMAAALVVVLVHPGSHAKTRAATAGGIGFGLFLDEVGKFVTKDVNYFFRPAIAIIYLVFVAFYLVGRDVILRRPLSDPQRLALAATAVADQALGQLGRGGRDHALSVLDAVTTDPELTAALRSALQATPAESRRPEARWTRVRDSVGATIRRVLEHRAAHVGLLAVLVVQTLLLVGELVLLLVDPQGHGGGHASTGTHIAQVASALSAAYTAFGGFRLARGDRAGALRVLVRSVVLSLLVTQVFVFEQYQASGVGVLVVDLVLLALLRAVGSAQPTAYQRTTAAQT